MTRRDFIQKWGTYVLGLFPIWVLDCYILSRYPMMGTTPILLPLTVAAVATLEGQVGGGAFGMGVGFLWETTYPNGWGAMIFVLTLLGYLAGTGVQYVLQKGFFGFFICSIALLMAVEGVTLLGWLISGKASTLLLLPLMGKQIALTLVYTPLVYLIFQKVFSKVRKLH